MKSDQGQMTTSREDNQPTSFRGEKKKKKKMLFRSQSTNEWRRMVGLGKGKTTRRRNPTRSRLTFGAAPGHSVRRNAPMPPKGRRGNTAPSFLIGGGSILSTPFRAASFTKTMDSPHWLRLTRRLGLHRRHLVFVGRVLLGLLWRGGRTFLVDARRLRGHRSHPSNAAAADACRGDAPSRSVRQALLCTHWRLRRKKESSTHGFVSELFVLRACLNIKRKSFNCNWER